MNVPRGITVRVQSFDVSINKLFKNYAGELFKKHLDANLELYINKKIKAVERRALTTKWVPEA